MKTKYYITRVTNIGNYYGDLHLMTFEDKYYWLVENYDTDLYDTDSWHEINKDIYDSIIKFYNEDTSN